MRRSEGLTKVQSIRVSGEHLQEIENLRRILGADGWDLSIGELFRAGVYVLGKCDRETLLGIVEEIWGRRKK